MSEVKEKMKQVIESSPEDATYEEILRELFFEQMLDRGMEDIRKDRVISNEEMHHRIRAWVK